jgi:hypothetical protein
LDKSTLSKSIKNFVLINKTWKCYKTLVKFIYMILNMWYCLYRF